MSLRHLWLTEFSDSEGNFSGTNVIATPVDETGKPQSTQSVEVTMTQSMKEVMEKSAVRAAPPETTPEQ